MHAQLASLKKWDPQEWLAEKVPENNDYSNLHLSTRSLWSYDLSRHGAWGAWRAAGLPGARTQVRTVTFSILWDFSC
eukprot:SAG31_NODE_1955_length_6823_cov_2.519780_7_plen_77_part_00